MRMKSLRLAFLLAGGAIGACHSPPSTTSVSMPDLSGVWLPDPSRAEPWPKELPLTPAARKQMDAFDPATNDPVAFCMPLGTPRNMLAADSPLEILQTAGRLTMVLQPDLSNAETRRIYLDGRKLPAEPDPSWFGSSVGKWDGSTLVIETVGIETDVILSSDGLPHSKALRVEERLNVVNDAERGKVLVDDITLHDAEAYVQPLKTRRYFTWAPNAPFHDSRCGERLWINKLWRDRLGEHAKAAGGRKGKS
jgi:hypothetical protein